MTTQLPEDAPRTPRQGRGVIATITVLFLVVGALTGWFLIQNQRQQDRLAELTAPGLLAVGVPPLAWQIDDVSALEDNRGLVTTYRYADGEPVREFRLLNLRAGSGEDLCGLLTAVEPALQDRCEVSGPDLSAVATGPSHILHAEGQLRAATLVVLIGHPATLDDERLRALVHNAELMSVEALLDQMG